MSGNNSRRAAKESVTFDRRAFVIVAAFWVFWLNNSFDVAADRNADDVGVVVSAVVVDVVLAVVAAVCNSNNTDVVATSYYF